MVKGPRTCSRSLAVRITQAFTPATTTAQSDLPATEFQARAAEEIDRFLPDGSALMMEMLSDDAVMRKQARVCRGDPSRTVASWQTPT